MEEKILAALKKEQAGMAMQLRENHMVLTAAREVRRPLGARLWEMARFCVVGGLCFLLDYGLLFACTEYGGVPYLWSSGISFSVSVMVNYWLCLAYVFRGAGEQSRRQRVLFLGSSVAGLGLNQVVMWALVDGLGVRGVIRAEAPCLGNGHRCGRFCLAVHVLRHVRLFCCVFPRRVVYYGYYQLS